jgi:PadR family transcriptional regulator PadR
MCRVAHKLRCVFNFGFCFVFTYHTYNIGGFGRKFKTQAHLGCLFQTECDILFHLAIAVSDGLVFGNRVVFPRFYGTLGRLISYSDKRAMGERRTDLLRGTLDLLVLKALSLEPLHGVGISRRITQMTMGAFQVSFGSLFPSLHRMEERGWVEAEWRTSENNRWAKYYRLTSLGRAQLKVEERDWNHVVKVMKAAVQST